MSKIQFEDSENSGLFYIEKDNKTIGKMTFRKDADAKIVIEHTEVNPDHNGKGYGKDLVQHAVKYARENDLKIIPQCSFAKSVIENTPEFQDVL